MGSFPAPAIGIPRRRAPRPDPARAPRPPLKAADYWRFADWLAPYFDALWLEDRSHYGSGNSSVGRIYHNSLLLTTHAIAALTGHDGPCAER